MTQKARQSHSSSKAAVHPVVLFGVDRHGKPTAARFPEGQARLAAKAAEQLRSKKEWEYGLIGCNSLMGAVIRTGRPMWKPEHRQAAERHGHRYPSDLTDAESAVVQPMIPPAKRGGRPRDVNIREVLNAIFYVLSTGCQWQALPKDLPPKSTAHYYLMLWDWDGTLARIHHALYVATRERAGREASPSAAIIDSQSAKAAQKGALRSIRRATMQARRSRDASATSSSIRSACC